eukprot:7984-Heterococcus_DN1.PRE.5
MDNRECIAYKKERLTALVNEAFAANNRRSIRMTASEQSCSQMYVLSAPDAASYIHITRKAGHLITSIVKPKPLSNSSVLMLLAVPSTPASGAALRALAAANCRQRPLL